MRRQRSAHRKILLVAVLMVIAASGCIKPVLPPQVTLQLPRRQTDAVQGKTIVIDPGHGGPELGAVGSNGLKEAEVNLGVALYLWGYLKDAGANPILTRTTDAGLYQQEPFILKNDLQARSDLSNVCGADLFVSVHHNSDALHTQRDDLMVFYKLSDSGQSRDVARDVCAGLEEKLGPGKAIIQAGNFYVLRSTSAPAILGEASFMTTKTNATMLAYHRTLAAEAAGYFMGICNYYQKGIPRITMLYPPQDAAITETRPEIRCSVYPGADNASLDATSITLQLDGKPVTSFQVRDKDIVYVPAEPLPNGPHQYCLAARNSSGNVSPRQCSSFTVAMPPRQVIVTPMLPAIPADGTAWTPITIEVGDALGRPVADGTRISLSASAGRLDNSTLATVAGRAQTLLRADSAQKQVTVKAQAGDAAGNGTLCFGAPEQGLLLLRIQGPSGNPLSDATLMRNGRQIAVSDAAGFAHDRAASAAEATYRIHKKGYLPSNISVSLVPGTFTAQTAALIPVDGGVFFGRTVMLDPAGSTPEALPILSALKDRIESAGGRAVLAWEEPPAPSDNKKVLLAGEERADIFLSVARSGTTASARYYYKSEKGADLAGLIARMLSQDKLCGRKECTADAAFDEILIHTAMPAVRVRVPEKLRASEAAVAESLYRALRELFRQ